MKKPVLETNQKPKKKTIPAWASFAIGVVLVLSIGYAVFTYVPFFSKYDHFVIGSDSMEPVILVGDVVLIDTQYSIEEMKVGDIIAFRADIQEDGTKEVVVHYLYSITEVDGVRIFKTKPEVSNYPDGWELVDADIVGLHVLTIPKIGPVLLFAQSTIGRIVIIADIVLIYVVVEMFGKSTKKKPQKPEIAPEATTETPEQNK